MFDLFLREGDWGGVWMLVAEQMANDREESSGPARSAGEGGWTRPPRVGAKRRGVHSHVTGELTAPPGMAARVLKRMGRLSGGGGATTPSPPLLIF